MNAIILPVYVFININIIYWLNISSIFCCYVEFYIGLSCFS